MYLSLLRLFLKHFTYILRMSITFPLRTRRFLAHHKHYTPLPPSSTKTIVVIGGSFSGYHLSYLLAHSLPTGYRVVLIERNSHFNYLFNFPRYSVLDGGKEGKAFIPFDGYMSTAPEGIYERMVGEVTSIREGQVELASGQVVAFEFLVLATGARQSPPAKLLSVTKKEACEELQALQQAIRKADKIALVGGGAVGVQIAGDIKTILPQKKVVLVHSRTQLLPNFNPKLHNYVIRKLETLGVEVMLGERPVLPKSGAWESTTLTFADGREAKFDLVIPCTGQTPNSSLLESFAPECISSVTRRILVKSTLQLTSDFKEANRFDRIYAIGDVAEISAPKMARAGLMQAELAWNNILAQIGGKIRLKEYAPVLAMEGILKLSLGKDENVTFVPDEGNGGYLFPGKPHGEELEVDAAWKYFKGDISTAATLDV